MGTVYTGETNVDWDSRIYVCVQRKATFFSFCTRATRNKTYDAVVSKRMDVCQAIVNVAGLKQVKGFL